jgi:hypothetical protein
MRTRKPYRAILNRAHGYTAQAGRLGVARRTPRSAQRAWNLAQAIAARYAAIERRWPAMALVFEQPDRTGLSVTNTYHTTNSSLSMNPRVLLRLLVPQRAGRTHMGADRTPAQHFGANVAPMTVAAHSRPQPDSQEQDDVITRIVRRAVREEHSLKANDRQAGRTSVPATHVELEEPAASRRSPSLARVYRRAATAKGDISVVAATARAERGTSSVVAGRDSAVAAAGQPPVDITRITDEVLQALDRRIVAQRERMGRN